MRGFFRRIWGLAAAAGSLGLLLFVAPGASAQAPPPASGPDNLAEMRARLDQLEKQNAEMMKVLQQSPTSPIGTNAPSVTPQDVAKIVDDALSQREAVHACDPAAKKDEWYQVGSDLGMTAAWKDGVWFSTKNKDFTFHVGGWVQEDFVWDGQSGAAQKDSTIGVLRDDAFLRRGRILLEGTAYECVEWMCIYDLDKNPEDSVANNINTTTGNNDPVSQFDDLWVGIFNIPVLGHVRIGHVRIPFGLENYTSSRYRTWIEQSLQTALQTEFAPGLWGYNNFCNNHVNVAWALTRHDSGNIDEDFGNDYIAAARIAALPIYYNDGRCMLHLAADYMNQSGVLNNSSTPGINDYTYSLGTPPPIRNGQLMPNFVTTGTFIAGQSNSVNLEFLGIAGPLWVQSEFIGTQISNAETASTTTPRAFLGTEHFWGGYVAAGYFLTGESRGYNKENMKLGEQRVNEPFFWVKGADGHSHWGLGAWEICARIDAIDLDTSSIRGGILRDCTLGLNWYLNDVTKLQLNYVISDRYVDGPKWSGTTQFVGTQVQISF